MIKITDLQRLLFDRVWARLTEKEFLLDELEQKLRNRDKYKQQNEDAARAHVAQNSAEK